MKHLLLIVAFTAATTTGRSQVSQSVQDSTIKYYIQLRYFIANTGQHDTAGMHALMDKHIYWRTKGLAQCRTEAEKEAFLQASVKAYQKYITGQ